jgi:hypothetical protein
VMNLTTSSKLTWIIFRASPILKWLYIYI